MTHHLIIYMPLELQMNILTKFDEHKYLKKRSNWRHKKLGA